MTNRDLIVIGASAGGVEALRTLLSGLPLDLPASVFIVLHTAANGPPLLAGLLNAATELTVAYPVSGEPIELGRVYVAPPNQHLLVDRGKIQLSRGPRENRCRPAVDPLFRSAARKYGNRVIGVILTGNLDDGTGGLQLIKKLGGLAVVQDPGDAAYPGMPSNALAHVTIDHVLPVSEIPELLVQLTREPLTEQPPAEGPSGMAGEGVPSQFICPECGGAMRESQESGLLDFHCHVGHAYSAQTLLDSQTRDVEGALWTALRALEDYAALRRKMAENARAHHLQDTAARFEESAEDAARQVEIIREVLLGD